jgi:hypothetical protein
MFASDDHDFASKMRNSALSVGLAMSHKIKPMDEQDYGLLYDEEAIRKFNPEGYKRFRAYKWGAAIFTAIAVPPGIVSIGTPSGIGIAPLLLLGCVVWGILTYLMSLEQKKAKKSQFLYEERTTKRSDKKSWPTEPIMLGKNAEDISTTTRTSPPRTTGRKKSRKARR